MSVYIHLEALYYNDKVYVQLVCNDCTTSQSQCSFSFQNYFGNTWFCYLLAVQRFISLGSHTL